MAAAVLCAAAFVFAGCDQVVETAKSNSGNTGTLRVAISCEGMPTPAQNTFISASAGGPALTVHPVFADNYWDSYVLSFVNTGGGSAPGDITIPKGDGRISGTVITVTVPVGTYNITVTAVKDNVRVAKGTVAVTVQEGSSPAQNVAMRPNTRAEDNTLPNGKLTYEIDLAEVSSLASGVFYILDTDNNKVDINGNANGTDIALTAAQNNKDDTGVEIPPGIYRGWIKLEKGGNVPAATLPGEIVYIYAGETSAFPKQAFNDSNFTTTVKKVTLLDLSGKVGVPVTGQAVGDKTVTTDQYTGSIAWLAGNSDFNGANFASETVYTAKVTLTASPGWTFAGAGNFTHTSVTPTTEDGMGGTVIVTIVFAGTEAVQGNGGLIPGFPNELIPVTGCQFTNGRPTFAEDAGTVTLTVDNTYHDVTWKHHEVTYTGNSITLDSAAYGAPHDFYLIVEGTKTGYASPSSRILNVLITIASEPGNVTPSITITKATIAEAVAWLATQEANTYSTPYTIKLAGDGGWDIANNEFQNYNTLATELASITRYVTIDMSDVAVTTLTGSGLITSNANMMKTLHQVQRIVGIVLPKTTTTMTATFYSMTYIKYVEFPAEVTMTLPKTGFTDSGVLKVVFRGENVAFASGDANYSRLGAGFGTVYNNGSKAGTYTRNYSTDTKWTQVE
jgi:hypothetical protein